MSTPINLCFVIGLEKAGWTLERVDIDGRERIYTKETESSDGGGFERKYELSLIETQMGCVTWDYLGISRLTLVEAEDFRGDRHPISIDWFLAADIVKQIEEFEDELLAEGVPFTEDYFDIDGRKDTPKAARNREIRQALNLPKIEEQLKKEWRSRFRKKREEKSA